MKDVACAAPSKDQGNHSCLPPFPAAPAPSVLVPDPLGLELLWATARHLSTSVSALLHSSGRAEHRSAGTRTSCPTGTGLLARPAPATSTGPDAVPDPATAAAAEHARHSTAAHCCHRYRPHPQASGHPPTDHPTACQLRI